MGNDKKLLFALMIFFLSFATACSDSIVENTPSIDDENKGSTISTTFSAIQKNVLNKSCAVSGCHVSGVVTPDLSGNSYKNIVNAPSSRELNYIEPNKPNQSYLLQKILGEKISGSRMPIGASPLPLNVVDSITAWIYDGAKNN